MKLAIAGERTDRLAERREMPRVGLLMHHDARVGPQLPRELAEAHVHGVDPGGAAAQQPRR